MKYDIAATQLYGDCRYLFEDAIEGRILPRFSSEKYALAVVRWGKFFFKLYHGSITFENSIGEDGNCPRKAFYTVESENGGTEKIYCEYIGDDDAIGYVWNRVSQINSIVAKQAVLAIAIAQDFYRDVVGFGEDWKPDAVVPILRFAATDKVRKLVRETVKHRTIFHTDEFSQLDFIIPGIRYSEW